MKTSTEKKTRLLAEASSGAARPKLRESCLGHALQNYCIRSSKSYDPDFDSKIRRLRPDWFANRSDEKKLKLLALPIGSERPKFQEMGKNLAAYTSPSHPSYDENFLKEIQSRQPNWFRPLKTDVRLIGRFAQQFEISSMSGYELLVVLARKNRMPTNPAQAFMEWKGWEEFLENTMEKQVDWVAAGKKAWQTRLAKKKKQSEAGFKAARTKKRKAAALKAWATRRAANV